MSRFRLGTIALFGVMLIGCKSPGGPPTLSSARSAASGDILTFAKGHPGGYGSEDRAIEYGDANMEESVKVLADIAFPWTVQKMIPHFLSERDAYIERLKHLRRTNIHTMWPEAEQQSRHCGCLATVLAASRDARAAEALGRSLELPDCPGGNNVVQGLFDYFLEDPRYKPVPRYLAGGEAYTNFLPIQAQRVGRWWFLNKNQILAEASHEKRIAN
jgi:hypothetical protein